MILVKLVSHLPFFVLYLISDFLYLLGYYVVRYRRKLVSRNLRNAFPELSEGTRNEIERAFYRNLCDYAVETLKLLTIRRGELGKRMLFTNPEVIEAYYSQNRSILYLASHTFNWEWLLSAGNFALPYPVEFIYQRVKANFFNRLSLQCRTRFGAKSISRKDVARNALRQSSPLRGIALVGDQYPGYGHDKKYQAAFLGQSTVFFLAINQLAILTQYPVVYFQVHKVRRGHYEAQAIVLGEPPYGRGEHSIIESYVRAVEKSILDHPSGWLWSHNRWKTRHLRQA